MWYILEGFDAPDGLSKRPALREAHLLRARQLLAEGRLLVIGPMPAIDSPDPGPAGFSGSLLIAEFDAIEAARDWLAQDPYTTGGVFERTEVRPFNKVLP
ncbi:YciI family protein [Lysobacter soyae]|uniref:YciI family protein n=1 Tax=Lysobacter soyae TaxID=2764185 RepID=A0ABX8WLB9_9GAMM|nr:YciI family protein [Lysobacter sp. CJ11]QYR52184.1 YciI family protein [Lysobacter sp. CJ11]